MKRTEKKTKRYENVCVCLPNGRKLISETKRNFFKKNEGSADCRMQSAVPAWIN